MDDPRSAPASGRAPTGLGWSGIFAGALGGLALLGWHFHWFIVTRLVPGRPSMRYATAIILVLCGGSAHQASKRPGLARGLAIAAVALGVGSFLQWAVGGTWQPEPLIHPGTGDIQLYPGLHSPGAASCAVLMGGALILATAPRPWSRATSAGMAGLVGLLSLIPLANDLMGLAVRQAWGGWNAFFIPFPAALGFLGLALGLWSWHLGPEGPLARPLSAWVSVVLFAGGCLVTLVLMRALQLNQQMALPGKALARGLAVAGLAFSGLVAALAWQVRLARMRLRSLREGEARLQAIFDQSRVAITLVGPDDRYAQFNEAWVQLTGYSATELAALGPMDLTHPEDREETRRLTQQVWRGQIPGYAQEKRYLRKDGALVWASAEVSGLRDSKGRVGALIGVVQDLTDRRRAEGLRDDFVSMVSHELRTPLTAIKGTVGLLLGGVAGPLPPQASELLGLCEANVHRLMALVGDLLDIQKIEDRRLAFRFGPVDLGALAQEAVAVNADCGAGAGITLRLEKADEAYWIQGDPGRIMQVMTNLLSNAVKFSPPGGEVRVGLAKRGDWIHLEVEDQGSGIPEAFRPQVFQKFAQAEVGTTRRVGGTGLGLSICKAIVDRHGGRIGFETELGRGTVFQVDFPAEGRGPDVHP